MVSAEIVVLNLTLRGSGFGHRVDTGESVFIPRTVVKAANLRPLDVTEARMIPNKYREDVPYMVIHAARQREGEVVETVSTFLPSFLLSAAHPEERN